MLQGATFESHQCQFALMVTVLLDRSYNLSQYQRVLFIYLNEYAVAVLNDCFTSRFQEQEQEWLPSNQHQNKLLLSSRFYTHFRILYHPWAYLARSTHSRCRLICHQWQLHISAVKFGNFWNIILDSKNGLFTSNRFQQHVSDGAVPIFVQLVSQLFLDHSAKLNHDITRCVWDARFVLLRGNHPLFLRERYFI